MAKGRERELHQKGKKKQWLRKERLVWQKGESMRTLRMHCNKEEREGEHDGHRERKRYLAEGRKIMHP
jgi:hypothetical protein